MCVTHETSGDTWPFIFMKKKHTTNTLDCTKDGRENKKKLRKLVVFFFLFFFFILLLHSGVLVEFTIIYLHILLLEYNKDNAMTCGQGV